MVRRVPYTPIFNLYTLFYIFKNNKLINVSLNLVQMYVSVVVVCNLLPVLLDCYCYDVLSGGCVFFLSGIGVKTV